MDLDDNEPCKSCHHFTVWDTAINNRGSETIRGEVIPDRLGQSIIRPEESTQVEIQELSVTLDGPEMRNEGKYITPGKSTIHGGRLSLAYF